MGEIMERKLRFIKRFSTHPCIIPMSVAEHCYYVIYYSWLVAQEFIKSGQQIDIKAVFEKALLHDIEEGITGDMHKFFKTEIIHKEIDKACKDKVSLEIYKIWKNARDDSIEGQIVNFADNYEVLIYCLEEAKIGNKDLYKIFKDQCKNMKEFTHPIFLKFISKIKAESDLK